MRKGRRKDRLGMGHDYNVRMGYGMRENMAGCSGQEKFSGSERDTRPCM